jgi:hypothetical protein
MVMLGIIVVFALMGAGIGVVLSRNGITPYGIGQQYGRHYAKDQGLEEEKPIESWKDQ